MSILDPGFWPWFWTVILFGITTAALCLVAGFVMTRRAGRRAADTAAPDRRRAADTAAHDRRPESAAHEHHPQALR